MIAALTRKIRGEKGAMQWVLFLLLVLIAAIMQISLINIVAVTNSAITPDLLLILLVFFAANCNATDSVITSFTIGLAADIASPAYGLMGPQILSFGLSGILLSDLSRVVSIKRIPHQVLAIFISGLAASLLAYALTLLRAHPSTSNLYADALWKPLYSALIGPFLLLPIGRLMRISRSRTRKY
jgi:rod shape-determining protein MreD